MLFRSTSPYGYQWSNGSTSEDLSNVVAGNYSLTVTDVNGCITNAIYNIAEPNKISASFNVINANCNLSNGSATVVATGGVGSFNYLWNNGTAGATITNQTLGVYSVTITDANNCAVVDSINIFNSGQAVVSLVTQINPTCNAYNNGQITVSVLGGLGPYQLQWSNGGSSYTNSNLAAGIYILTVTDITGCSSQKLYTLTEPDSIAISFSGIDEHCGKSDGSITTSIIGGNGLYTYQWSTNSSSSVLSNLTAGTYTLTVTDNLGCTAFNNFNIVNIPAPLISHSQVANVNCYGSSTGIIDIDVNGGISPYSYQWSNAVVTEDNINIIAGTYSVTVTDQYGCTVRRIFNVTQPDSINISGIVDDAGCGNNNGEIFVSAIGEIGRAHV